MTPPLVDGNLNDALRRLDAHAIADDAAEIRAFLIVRNEALRLPYLLSYYRALGVARFFVVDNGSIDGTTQILLGAPDVHVFGTQASYSQSLLGSRWLRPLLDRYGVSRWCVLVDADEVLVYPHCERIGLRRLTDFLDAEGAGAFYAPLLDMYSAGPIAAAHYPQGENPLEVCPYFDPGNRADMRDRVFGVRADLRKYPLIKGCPEVKVLGGGHHLVHGTTVSEVMGRTLHFKFLSDFPARVRLEAERGEHWAGGEEYKRYDAVMLASPALSPHHEGSCRYVGSWTLVEHDSMLSTPAFDKEAQRSAVGPATRHGSSTS